MPRKSIAQIFKEIWPKLAIFTVMLVITVFQKHPMTLKALGQSQAEIDEQFRTGKFKTTSFEKDYLAYVQVEKIIFTAVVFLIFWWFRQKNLKYEEEQAKIFLEQQREKEKLQKNRVQEQKIEFTEEDIQFYKKANEKLKNKEQSHHQKIKKE